MTLQRESAFAQLSLEPAAGLYSRWFVVFEDFLAIDEHGHALIRYNDFLRPPFFVLGRRLSDVHHPIKAAGLDPIGMSVVDLAFESPAGPIPDRKSTRLNSSHTVISYAVFCLKKK